MRLIPDVDRPQDICLWALRRLIRHGRLFYGKGVCKRSARKLRVFGPAVRSKLPDRRRPGHVAFLFLKSLTDGCSWALRYGVPSHLNTPSSIQYMGYGQIVRPLLLINDLGGRRNFMKCSTQYIHPSLGLGSLFTHGSLQSSPNNI